MNIGSVSSSLSSKETAQSYDVALEKKELDSEEDIAATLLQPVESTPSPNTLKAKGSTFEVEA